MLFPGWLLFPRQKTEAVRRPFFVVMALSAGLLSLPAQAESGAYVPYSGIIHGTEGADPVEITVANDTGLALNCEAALAHWYSDELGRITPGGELTLTLWRDPKTGVLNLMNATNDRMPVEALWCSNDAARTRLNLPIAADRVEATLRFSCHASSDRELSCDSSGG